MPVPLTLGSLKQGLSQLVYISIFWFRIQYGSKTITHDSPLTTQGIGNNVTVWLLLGGANTEMSNNPTLPSSTATPTRQPTSTHWSRDISASCSSSPSFKASVIAAVAWSFVRFNAVINIFTVARSWERGLLARSRSIHSSIQVQEAFPENLEQFLERNDMAFPVQQADWEALLNSFKEHLVEIAKHVDFKINPARKYRLLYKASGLPRTPPTGKLMNNETFTLSNLNILSARPLMARPDTGPEISLSAPRIN